MNFYLKIETFLKLWNIQSKTSKTIAVWLQNSNDQFSFKPVKKDMIAKEISNLKTGKAVHSNYIPTKILIDLENLFDTKKKENHIEKYIYRPVSNLSNISKLMKGFYVQMYD